VDGRSGGRGGLLVGVPVLELVLVVLVLFSAAGNAVVLFGEDADSAGGDFVVAYGLVILAYCVDAEFLGWEVSKDLKR
jgi:hypothetical protein